VHRESLHKFFRLQYNRWRRIFQEFTREKFFYLKGAAADKVKPYFMEIKCGNQKACRGMSRKKGLALRTYSKKVGSDSEPS